MSNAVVRNGGMEAKDEEEQEQQQYRTQQSNQKPSSATRRNNSNRNSTSSKAGMKQLKRTLSKQVYKKSEFKQLNQRILDAPDCETICTLIQSKSSSFNEVNMATCWLKLGQMLRDDREGQNRLRKDYQTYLDRLLEASCQSVAQWSPRCISNALLGMAHMKDASRALEFMQTFRKHILESVSIFPFQEKVNLMWALATLKVDPGVELVRAISKSVNPSLLDAKPRAVSNLFWSCIVLGHELDDDFQALVEEYLSQDMVVSLNPQDLTLFLWGFANIGRRPSPMVFNNLIKQSLEIFNEFSGQNLSNFFWSCATLDLKPPLPLAQAMEVQAMKVMPQLSSQAVSNILWAYATLNIQPGKIFFQILQAHTVVIMSTCKPQSLSLLMWAMAILDRQPAPGFVRSLVSHTLSHLSDFKPRNVANISWAFANLRIHPGDDLLEKFDDYAQRNKHKFCAQSFCNLIWAFACLCYTPSQEFLVASAGIIDKLPYDPLWVSHCLWSIAVFASLDVKLPHAFIDSFIEVILKNVRADDPDLSIRFWNAFYQFALAGKFGDYKYLSRLPEDLVQKSRQKSQSSALDVSISNSQNEVYEVLRDAGLCVRPEALVFEDCFSVDILYEPTGADVDPQSPTCIAIEVDGPTHYRADDTSQIIGKTQLRNWVLKSAGVNVVVIRSEEWYRLPFSKEARHKYLITALQSVLSEEDKSRLSPWTRNFYSSGKRKSTSEGGE